ncbi:MAG: Ldh family oxidoreductase [Alphaproteobacteria bacterium]|nr:Ldh family oxidoreductase [Alphaproteobacteria bacterium]
MNARHPSIDAAILREFVTTVFVRLGMSDADAAIEAEVLVWANLRGVDSHGVLRLPRYLALFEQGEVKPRPTMRFERETAVSAILEADHALGPIAMTRAMDRAIEKARAAAIGWVAVRDTAHSGAVGYYALRAAAADMVGLVIVTSVPNMAYHGARAAGVATSPIAIAVPGATHAPLVIDMATAVAALGKIVQARNAGTALPAGWALDRDGNPTTDAAAAVLPLPLGGAKGAGLSLLFECVTSLLVGNPIISATLGEAPGDRRHRQNAVAVAIDIAAFTDVAGYKANVDALAAAVKALPRAAGCDEILVPGERGDRILVARHRHGIPLPPGTLRGLIEIAARLAIAMPPLIDAS